MVEASEIPLFTDSKEILTLKTLLLNKEQVRQLISLPEVIKAVENAFMSFSDNKTIQPPYVGIHLPEPRGEIDFKTGYYGPADMISLKASSGGFTQNQSELGLPSNMGTIVLFDGRSGALLCVMDGSLLTGLRTGASGAVSVKALARPDAQTITCIGTGIQARMQIRAIAQVMQIKQIYAWSRRDQQLAQFKADIEQELGITVVLADSKQAAVEQADILVTTTRGTGDVVDAAWIKPGTHIVAIGTDAKGKQELDPEIFRGAKVVTDSTVQCLEKGETFHPVNNKIISEADIHGEIGEILLGRKAGRENATEITIFDSTGMAIQDNTAATSIYKNALKQEIGEFFAFS